VLEVTVTLRKPPKCELMLPQIVEMAEAGSGVDLISRALGIGAKVVRYALHLHRTGKQPPGRVDGRRQPRQPGKPFVPQYKQIAPEVDRRRKGRRGIRAAGPEDEGQPPRSAVACRSAFGRPILCCRTISPAAAS